MLDSHRQGDVATDHADPYCQRSRIEEANGRFLSSLYPYFHTPHVQKSKPPTSRPGAVRTAGLSHTALQTSAQPVKRPRAPALLPAELRSGPALAEVSAIPHDDFEINSDVREQRVAQWQAETEWADHQLVSSGLGEAFPLQGATAGNPYTVGHLFRALEAYKATKQKVVEYDKLLSVDETDDAHPRGASPHQMEDPAEDTEVQSWITAWREKREAAQQVSFKARVEETDRRFKDQLAVHREMNQAFSRTAQIQKELQVMKAEKRTTTLVSALLQKQNEQLLRVFPTESPFWKQMEAEEARMARIAQVQMPYMLRPDGAAAPPIETKAAATTRMPASASSLPGAVTSPTVASPNTVDPMLQDILNQFSKPKARLSSEAESDGKSRSQSGKRNKMTEPPKKTLASISVQALEPAPTPYVRIRYVLRKEEPSEEEDQTVAWSSPPREEYADDFDNDDDIEDEATSDNNKSQPFNDHDKEDSILSEEGAEEDVHRKSYESGMIDEGDDVSAENSSENNGSYSDDAIEDESDNLSSEDDSLGRQRKKQKKGKLTTDEVVSLQDMLKEFYAACRNTNALGKALLERKGSGSAHGTSRRPSTKMKKTDISSSSAGITDKEDTIKVQVEKEFADIRRLRRFNKRIKENMRAVDLQRKAHEAKRRLLDKAVRLSKAVRKQRKNKKILIRDIIDDEDDPSEIGSALDSLDSRKKRKKGKAKRRARGSSASDIDDIEDEVISDYDLGDLEEGSDDIIDDDSVIAEDDSAYGSDDFIEDDDGDNDMIYDESERGADSNASIEDEMDDMIADDANSDNVDDVIESDAILDVEEEGLIERLASVSDVDDIASSVDLEDLATGSEHDGMTGSIVDEVASEEKKASFHSSDAGSVEDDDASDKDKKEGAAARSSPSSSYSSSSSSSLSTHSSDADVSSPYPSSHPSADYELNSSERSEMEAEDGEEALRTMEQDLRLTASRRQSALEQVGGVDAGTKPFTALFDPTYEESSTDDATDALRDERSRLKSMLSMPPSRRPSTQVPAIPSPPSSSFPQLFASEECPPSLRAVEVCAAQPSGTPPTEPGKESPIPSPVPPPLSSSHVVATRKHKRLTETREQDGAAHYLADDLVALNEWKRRQKELIHQLFAPPAEAAAVASQDKEKEEDTNTQAEPAPDLGPSEADYHWGQLEALLETRFGATPAQVDEQQYNALHRQRFLEFSTSSEDEGRAAPHAETSGTPRTPSRTGTSSETITGSERT